MAWYVFHHRGVNDFQLVGTCEREAETFTIVKERGRPDQVLGYRHPPRSSCGKCAAEQERCRHALVRFGRKPLVQFGRRQLVHFGRRPLVQYQP